MTQEEQKLIGLLASLAVQACQKPRERMLGEGREVIDDCVTDARFSDSRRPDRQRDFCLSCKASHILQELFKIRVGRPEPVKPELVKVDEKCGDVGPDGSICALDNGHQGNHQANPRDHFPGIQWCHD